MTCPQCGHEQPDVFSQCQKCRYIFPSPRVGAPRSSTFDAAVGLPVEEKSPLPALLGAIVAVVILAVTLWWLRSPVGLPVQDGAYVNENHHFAISVPVDWLVLTENNYREMFEKFGDRLPKSLQEGLTQRRIEVGFLKLLQGEDFSPNINVVVLESEIPDLDEKRKNEAAQAITAQFSRMFEKYELEKSELVKVDELTSARFSSNTTMKFIMTDSQPLYGRMPEKWTSFDSKLVQTLVPGRKRAYIITCTAKASQYPEYRRAFEDAVESFRVLERPPRFGPIVMAGLQGGLIGGLGYLLYHIVTALIALVKRS